MSLKSGDVVELKSGSPKMTIRNEDRDGYRCEWFLDGKVERAVFKEEQLKFSEANKPAERISA